MKRQLSIFCPKTVG